MMTEKISAPRTVPRIVPRPPFNDTPPITAMAMASSSYIIPMPACADRFFEVSMIVAAAVSIPAMV
ncbi:hypothetical protein GALL_512420 [mine drainage metagenome]|uniref:Uncharacterized protein n=1 Tax=mine drainage metagenome TaxID=410659 RepID=A0A1J5PUF6_9ZZZZ